jgi:hypothetical protein
MARTLLMITSAGAALVLGVSAAFGAADPVRDAGDAAAASLRLKTARVQVMRDHGDAAATRDARQEGEAAIAYFKANERATIGPGPYADVAQRGGHVNSSQAVGAPAATTGFDWGDAAVGASTAAVLALLLSGTVVLVRHTRGRQLVR